MVGSVTKGLSSPSSLAHQSAQHVAVNVQAVTLAILSGDGDMARVRLRDVRKHLDNLERVLALMPAATSVCSVPGIARATGIHRQIVYTAFWRGELGPVVAKDGRTRYVALATAIPWIAAQLDRRAARAAKS